MCTCCMNRRSFLGVSTALTAATAVGAFSKGAAAATPDWPADYWDGNRKPHTLGRPLRVQPILMYRTPEPRVQDSWKSWGGIQTEEAAAEEKLRITEELESLSRRADFPLELLPVAAIKTEEEAQQAHASNPDVVIVYPATGSGQLLQSALLPDGGLIFVRHRSGPVYYWYEALSVRQLTKSGEAADPRRRASVEDVVVDDTDELLWRLRARFAAHNFMGARVLAIGGAQGKYDDTAPQFAQDRFKMDIVDASYTDLEKRIVSVLADPKKMALCETWTDQYLALPRTTLNTERDFVVRSFMLYGIFKDLMEEAGTDLMTINQCMSTIIPMSQTTACLTLGLLNDEGQVAFCEADFVIVPAGIFLRYLSGKPVFMHNSTFPHNGVVTCAHCTGPRRMDGVHYDPAEILTHYESEYGAAPKVEIPVGQELTFISPEFATGRWVGIRGVVEDNPFLEICRSQQDVRIHGDWRRLINEVRDSHWMMVYGDYLKEIAYAAPQIGVTVDAITA
ncbi:MAG: sugar isomerase [Candidatus Hydrogenedentales bacterium]